MQLGWSQCQSSDGLCLGDRLCVRPGSREMQIHACLLSQTFDGRLIQEACHEDGAHGRTLSRAFQHRAIADEEQAARRPQQAAHGGIRGRLPSREGMGSETRRCDDPDRIGRLTGVQVVMSDPDPSTRLVVEGQHIDVEFLHGQRGQIAVDEVLIAVLDEAIGIVPGGPVVDRWDQGVDFALQGLDGALQVLRGLRAAEFEKARIDHQMPDHILTGRRDREGREQEPEYTGAQGHGVGP